MPIMKKFDKNLQTVEFDMLQVIAVITNDKELK
jgi:hypothetical protein